MEMKDTLALAGFAAVIVQLWFAVRVIRANLRARIYTALQPIQQAFLNYPRLRPHFFHGVPFPESAITSEGKLSEDFLLCRGISEMFYDLFENLYLAEMDRKNWTRYIRDIVRGSPFLSEYLWDLREDIHPEKLRQLVEHTISGAWEEIPKKKETQLKRALALLQ